MSQSKLNVADELAESQKQISIAEFFEQNKQMLGFGKESVALVTAVKEAVDNSLDASEEANILPDIYVKIEKHDDFYTLIVEDNGPGIPKDSVPKVFGKLLYGSRFHKLAQRRGQQGIGISATVLYSQLTSGNPARIQSKPSDKDKAYYVELGIDTDNNEPEIKEDREITWDKDHGTRIEVDLKGNMRARKKLHKYINLTAVVNPHATIELHEPENSIVYDERASDELPDDVEEIKPHPHGVEPGTLQSMLENTEHYAINAFLQEEFTRVGSKTAGEIINNFKSSYYGNEMRWPFVTKRTTREQYLESIKSVVNRKGKEATDMFAEKIVAELEDEALVSKEEICESVDIAAEKTSTETGKTFGNTVKTNAVDSVWNLVVSNILAHCIMTVDEETIDRKNQHLVARVGNQIGKLISDKEHKNRLTKTELENVIDQAVTNVNDIMINGNSFGDTAKEKIITALWGQSHITREDIPSINEIGDDMTIITPLYEGMQASDALAPPSKCLSPIKEENILKGLKSRFDADFYTACTRDAGVANGHPFIAEAGIAYGGEIDDDSQIDLSRFANRVPLVYEKGGCLITKVVKNIRWNNYYRKNDKLSQSKNSLPQGPMILLVHVASTNVPFTSEAKDAVADVPAIENEIENAVRNVARDLKNHLNQERSKRKRKEKENVIGGILNEMAEKIESITDSQIESKKQSQARILNNILLDTSGDSITLTNFGGKSEDIIIETESENVDLESEYVSETDSAYRFEISISKGESIEIQTDGPIDSYDIKKPAKAKVTRNNA